MFGIDTTILAFIALAGFSAGAVAYAFLFNTHRRTRRRPDRRLDTVKKAETDRSVVKASRDRVAEAAKRRKSVQDSLKELDAKQKATRQEHQEAAAQGAAQAGRHDRSRSSASISIRSSAASCSRSLAYFLGAPLLVLPGALLAGALGLPRWFVSFRRGAPRQGVPQRVSQRARHHRARRQVRPAAQRRHPADRHRIARAGQGRVPPHRRIAAGRHVDPGSRDAHARDHALSGSRLLRHRHPDPAARPAAICRKRWAICRACCATARR